MRQPTYMLSWSARPTYKLDQVGHCRCPLPGLFGPRGPSSGDLSNQGQRVGCWVDSTHNLHSIELFQAAEA